MTQRNSSDGDLFAIRFIIALVVVLIVGLLWSGISNRADPVDESSMLVPTSVKLRPAAPTASEGPRASDGSGIWRYIDEETGVVCYGARHSPTLSCAPINRASRHPSSAAMAVIH